MWPEVLTIPPSEVIVSPTVYAPALEHKNNTKPAMSSGLPTLFLGFFFSISDIVVEDVEEIEDESSKEEEWLKESLEEYEEESDKDEEYEEESHNYEE
mgnify:CR=1 FL=1